MAKAGENTVIKLKKDIQNGTLARLYLFYGTETYLRDYYIQKIFDAVPDNGFAEFNHIKLDGREASLTEIDEALESFPMMADKRIVMISDSGIFKKATAEQKDFYAERLGRTAEDTVLIFCESEVDKRGVLYKAADKNGEVIEFAPLSEADAVTWLMREASARGSSISKDAAQYFVSIAEPSLGNLKNELDKCVMYCEGEIKRTDVDRLVSRSFNTKIFDICDCMMDRNADGAVSMIMGMMEADGMLSEGDGKKKKRTPFDVICAMYSSFDKMLYAKLLAENGERNADIAQKLKVPPFIAGKYTRGAAKFSTAELMRLIIGGCDAVMAIKRGEKEQWAALEDYVYGFFAK